MIDAIVDVLIRTGSYDTALHWVTMQKDKLPNYQDYLDRINGFIKAEQETEYYRILGEK